MRYDGFLIQLCLSFQIAMGQGQADLAIRTLKDCARNGEWLCLKNLHLVTSWLPVLEKVTRMYWKLGKISMQHF